MLTVTVLTVKFTQHSAHSELAWVLHEVADRLPVLGTGQHTIYDRDGWACGIVNITEKDVE